MDRPKKTPERIKTMNMHFINSTLNNAADSSEREIIKTMLLKIRRARANKADRERELIEFCDKIHAREYELAAMQ